MKPKVTACTPRAGRVDACFGSFDGLRLQGE